MVSPLPAVILLFCAIFATGVNANSICNFTSYQLYPHQEVKACLESIPFSAFVSNQTIRACTALIELNAFKDLDLSPPSPFENLAIDLAGELAKLKGVTFGSDHEFQQKISDIFSRLKDPHSIYVKPECYQPFIFAVPFRLNSTLENGAQVLRLDTLVPAYFTAHPEARDYLGKRLLKIKVDGTFIDPLVAIGDWAEKSCYFSKSQAARFNQAIKQDYWVRSMHLYGIPESNSTTVELETIGVVELPWLGLTGTTINGAADFASLCPIVNESASTANEATHHGGPSPIEMLRAFLYSHASTGSSDPAVPKTAMLRLASFMHTDAYQYQRSLIAAMKAVALAAPERFIVDVRGNGGGVVVRGYELVKYLVPNMFPLSGESVPSYACDACVNVVLAAAEPKYVVNVDVDVEQRPVHHLIDPACPIDQYDVRHNDVLDVFWSSFGGTMQADWISHKGYTDWYYPGKNRTFTNMSGAKFNHLFSSNFTLLSDLSFLEANPSPITFDPQHFAVLTDGLCGSTCAAFSKRLHEAHAAKMIGVGGVWVNGTAPTAPFDIASFAGGSVIDSQLIDQIRDQVSPSPQYTASELPSFPHELPRNGYLRFAFYDLYAWDWTVRQKGIPLEFLVNPADWVIPTWPAANDLTLNLLTSVFKLSAPTSTSAPRGKSMPMHPKCPRTPKCPMHP
ncbi:hypothetical protein PAPYR_5963 [Paratrimastix pyriformis]|uniref:Tail specific protease domain-containing protein n=1 Tax=Paratrimastix pyriformis TaxID=342808 RepID=A0ABQ8UIP2_9EUKA|nr:hypothetical protein PAPYR_5963 [Paratrimastix pyriformis]